MTPERHASPRRAHAVHLFYLLFLLPGCPAASAPPEPDGGPDATTLDAPRDAADAPGACADPDVDRDGVDSMACGGLDCDDTDPARAPGNVEICDRDDHDEDCDPSTFGVRDGDGDGEPDASCCNVDDAGGQNCGTDCDDTRAGVGPSSPEVCNAIDDDCDDLVDEGVTNTYFADADGDLHGDPADFRDDLCAPTAAYPVAVGDDCDDADPSSYPAAREICDGRDNDCSSGGGPLPAEDADGDEHTSETYPGCEEAPGNFPIDDCNDAQREVHPGADFHRVPFCRGGVGTACHTTTGWQCLGPDCMAVPLGAGTIAWDYDCNGTENLEPVRATACSCDSQAVMATETEPGRMPGCGVCLATTGSPEFVCTSWTAGPLLVSSTGTGCGAPATYRTCGSEAVCSDGCGARSCPSCSHTDFADFRGCR